MTFEQLRSKKENYLKNWEIFAKIAWEYQQKRIDALEAELAALKVPRPTTNIGFQTAVTSQSDLTDQFSHLDNIVCDVQNELEALTERVDFIEKTMKANAKFIARMFVKNGIDD